ncbi:MAG: extracellular solute-binding protein [Lachnospiraceae bacterium]
MATLKDVARDAGVSIATVSCCLSGKKPVSSETRTRVFDSIEKLKYIPNASARNLKAFQSKLVGVVLTDIDHLYHTEIFKGISAHLQSQGYSVSVAFSNNSPDIESRIIEDFISQNAAGLIIVTCQPQNTDFFQMRILDYEIPTVFIERNPADLFVNFVGFHDYATAHHITNDLIAKGYSHISLVCGPQSFSSERECLRGYRDAFADHGLALHENYIRFTNMSKEDTFKSVLTSLVHLPLEAIITTSENIAYGTLEALATHGLRVGEDLQLITFSEESWTKSNHIPGVFHTSRTPFDLGSTAACLLLKNILSPSFFESKIITLEDDVVRHALTVPPRHTLTSERTPVPVLSKKIRALMVDLATAHSVQLLSEDFTRQTGIEIEFDFLPQNEVLQRITDTIDQTTAAYDIYMYDIPWLNYMVQNSLVCDLSDFITGDFFKMSRIFQENMENCMYEDKYYGIPLIGGSQLMFYRKDLFENWDIIKSFKRQYKISLSPPKTWTQFNGTSRFFTRAFNPESPTEYGTSFAGITDEELAPELLIRLWAYGGALWDSYNRPCLHTMANAQAFSSILETLDFVPTPPFATSIKQTVADFSDGKTAMLITYTEYAAQISESIRNQIIGRMGYEVVPGRRPASIGWNIGVNPFSTMKEDIYLFFNWLCQRDISYYMTILDGQSPVIAPYHNLELLRLYPWLAMTEKSFDYTQKRNGPYKRNTLIIPQDKIEKILCNVLRNILNEGMSISDALEYNQEHLRRLFASYGYPKPYCR